MLVSGLQIDFDGSSIFSQLIISMFCGVIVFLSSTFFLTGVLHFSETRPFFSLWIENFNWLIPYYLAFGVISFALIIGYTSAGILGLLAIMAPLLILRLSQFQYIDKTKTVVKKLRKTNAELTENNLMISEINEDILLSLANTIDLRDSYTMGHSTGVAELAVLLAQEYGLSPKKVDLVRKSALLHDIGKIGIPDRILFKPDLLSSEEFEIIKEHPSRGARIVEVNASLVDLGSIIRHHHERFDGRGYPDGLQGVEIPLEARIVCLADSVQAMSSNRPYRTRLELAEVKAELLNHAGTQFDPEIVDIFIKLADKNLINLEPSRIGEEIALKEFFAHHP
jgi:putative nucleotidyltransferase with HDIG domain